MCNRSVKTVTVLGANGTMGANVAAIFASFGNAKVYCVGRDINKVRETIPRIWKSVRAESIDNNLIPCNYSNLKDCIPRSDLIFESCSEDIDVKKNILTEISKCTKGDSIIATGTSGLSIEQMSKFLPDNIQSNFFGVHFFNPPYNLPLCELISTNHSNIEKREFLSDYLTNILCRTVVEVKDSPAFLANRIGFQFINKCLQTAEEYKENGGIDYIDALLGSFTGRAMPPLATVDFVGLDTHKAIVDNIYNNTNDIYHDSFALPKYVDQLVAQGKLGRKVNGGLFKTKIEDDKKVKLAYDIVSSSYRKVKSYNFPFAEQMKQYINEGLYEEAYRILVNDKSKEANICLEFLSMYIIYSYELVDEMNISIVDVDNAMATGFNWCPPSSLLRLLSKVTDVNKLFEKKIKADSYSTYDYRPFIKSGIRS